MDTRVSSQPPLSRTFVYKKVTKPLLERRRRARISKCLDELKSIVIGSNKVTDDSMNRLEKADILELTVCHLNKLLAANTRNRFQEGFDECAAEACHYLEQHSDYDGSLSEHLVEHLETFTGPLSIQVPQYKLSFTAEPVEQAPSYLNTPTSLESEGLLIKSSDVIGEIIPQHVRSQESVFIPPHPKKRIAFERRSVLNLVSNSDMWRPW